MAESRERETFQKLSVFYPMWNEEIYIERALVFGKRACENLVAAGDIADYELIVVDDKSTDGSASIAADYAKRDSRVKVMVGASSSSTLSRSPDLATSSRAWPADAR